MHSHRCQDKRFEGKYSGFAPRDVQNITLTILETHLRGGHLLSQVKRLSGIKRSFRQTCFFKTQSVKNCKPSLNKLQWRRIEPFLLLLRPHCFNHLSNFVTVHSNGRN